MMNGTGGWWMGAGFIVFLAFVVIAVAWSMRQTDKPHPLGSAQNAEEVLADRLARGEIDEEEYRRRLATLRA